ncbi:MAG: OmpH family outer membrane protein [Verrucomicrobiota bacterium]
MINRTIVALILAAFSVSPAFAQQAPKTIAVNFDTLFQEFYEVKDALAKFQTSIDAVDKELQTMASEMQPQSEKLQELVAKSRNPAMTDDARQEAEQEAVQLDQELRQRQQELGQFQQQQRQTLGLRRNEIRKQFVEKIREVVSQYAESSGAELVVNIAPVGGNVGGIIFVADAYDKTNDVLAILNADAPESAE